MTITIRLKNGLQRSFDNGEKAYDWCTQNTDWFAKELAAEKRKERRKRKGKPNARN